MSDYNWVRDSGYFDGDWYRARYADVAETGLDPIRHFLDIGALEGRDPGPRFSTRRYRDRHPELAGTTRNPLLEFLLAVRWRQLIRGEEHRDDGDDHVAPYATDEHLVRMSPLFDAGWYRSTYPDIRDPSVDPVRHYIEFGASERRDPGPHFSTARYLDEHPELIGTGENPLAHALRAGR